MRSSSCVPEGRLSCEPCLTENLGKGKEHGGERVISVYSRRKAYRAPGDLYRAKRVSELLI